MFLFWFIHCTSSSANLFQVSVLLELLCWFEFSIQRRYVVLLHTLKSISKQMQENADLMISLLKSQAPSLVAIFQTNYGHNTHQTERSRVTLTKMILHEPHNSLHFHIAANNDFWQHWILLTHKDNNTYNNTLFSHKKPIYKESALHVLKFSYWINWEKMSNF